MKRVLLGTFLLLCFVLSVFASGKSESDGSMAGKMTDVTIQIEGSAVPYYAPIFTAIENGYFAEEGLNVDYMFGNAADIAKNVAVGNVEFGFPNGEPVILAKSQGVPVKVVHSTLQHGLGATIFLKDSGIRKAADLKGKSVAITSLGSPNYVQLQVLLEDNGMSLEDIDLEIIGTEGIVPALVNKRVDAICFSMLRTFELKSQGVDVDEFRSDKFMPSFGNVVITGDAYLKGNADKVAGFKKALSKSMKYLSNPENMKKMVPVIIEKYTPTYSGKEDYISSILTSVYANYLWTSDAVKEHGFGYSDVSKWQSTADKMSAYELIKNPVNAEELVWNN